MQRASKKRNYMDLYNDRKILLPSEFTRQKDLYNDLTLKKM